MPHWPDELGYNATLGAFIQGIPAVFVQLDLYAKNYSEMKEYLRFYQTSREDNELNKKFDTNDLMIGYEYVNAHLHEIRHFHDALLSWPLFESFIHKSKRAMAMLQLATHLDLSQIDLPISYTQANQLVAADRADMIHYLETIDASFQARVGRPWDAQEVLGQKVRLSHLLEANAIVLELVNIIHVHGFDAAEKYLNCRIRLLPDIYTDLLYLFRNLGGSMQEWLELAHWVLSASLYDDADPVVAFRDLITPVGRSAADMFAAAAKRIEGLFSQEDAFRQRIEKIYVLSLGENARLDLRSDLGVIGEIIRMPSTLFEMRTELIRVYAEQWGLNPRLYLEHQEHTPFPPTVLYPIDRMDDKVSRLRYSDLLERCTAPFVIAGVKEYHGDVFQYVSAAIVPTLRQSSPISFEVIDQLMFWHYAWRRCFGPPTQNEPIWGKIIEDSYARLFDKLFRRR